MLRPALMGLVYLSKKLYSLSMLRDFLYTVYKLTNIYNSVSVFAYNVQVAYLREEVTLFFSIILSSDQQNVGLSILKMKE